MSSDLFDMSKIELRKCPLCGRSFLTQTRAKYCDICKNIYLMKIWSENRRSSLYDS